MKKLILILFICVAGLQGCSKSPEDSISVDRAKAARERVKAGESAAPNMPR